jgi:hypothetical protein
MKLLNPASPEAEREYAQYLILEFQAIEAMSDPLAWDDYLESLDEYDWLIYQSWRNRVPIFLPSITFSADVMSFASGVGRFIDMFKEAAETMRRAVAFLDSLPPIPPKVLARIESEIRYMVAGYPLGKSHKGRKKWEKRRA